jgi:hypothetical protein
MAALAQRLSRLLSMLCPQLTRLADVSRYSGSVDMPLYDACVCLGLYGRVINWMVCDGAWRNAIYRYKAGRHWWRVCQRLWRKCNESSPTPTVHLPNISRLCSSHSPLLLASINISLISAQPSASLTLTFLRNLCSTIVSITNGTCESGTICWMSFWLTL